MSPSLSPLAQLVAGQATAINNVAKEAHRQGAIDGARALAAALRPFVEAYEKAADEIGDSDLDNEQPRPVRVTLGDCRSAARALREFERV